MKTRATTEDSNNTVSEIDAELYTENFKEHRDTIQDLSIAHNVRVVDYVIALSQYLNDDTEILDDMDNILDPFYTVINKLRTDEKCRHGGCGGLLYKSDLPQYDFVCPKCDENF